MLKLTVSRPNTIGVTQSKEFDNYNQAEMYIESRCEKLADQGWELSELEGSNSKSGTIEATHDNEADILVISWDTYQDE